MSSIVVEKLAPLEVGPGRAFEYEIKITNQSVHEVDAIVLTETLLSGLRIERSSPKSQVAEPRMGRWVLGPLAPRGTASVYIVCQARNPMRFRSWTSFTCSTGG